MFQESPGIQELVCSGEVLNADATVVSMVLFTEFDDDIIATVNIVKEECTTSNVFSSCVISNPETRRSKLRTLIMDLFDDDSRKYGCEISSIKSGERSKSDKWILEVTGYSKFSLWFHFT